MDPLDLVPPALLARSGAVLYGGRASLRDGHAPIYVLGLNPGGDPEALAAETIERSIENWRGREQDGWSAYVDERWAGMPPGRGGIQPELLHLFRGIGVDPRSVPASNLVFVRSRSEQELKGEMQSLMNACWPVHRTILRDLQIRTVVCLGKTVGAWAREQLSANRLVDSFTEHNRRGWVSTAHSAPSGIWVLTLTHPSRAGWTNPAADPTPLVRAALGR